MYTKEMQKVDREGPVPFLKAKDLLKKQEEIRGNNVACLTYAAYILRSLARGRADDQKVAARVAYELVMELHP